MTIFNREDPRTVLPQLEALISKVKFNGILKKDASSPRNALEVNDGRNETLTVDWDGNIECSNLGIPKGLPYPTITKTEGNSNITVRAFFGYGKMRMLVCSITTTASVSAGNNAFKGTISSEARPAIVTYSAGYVGSSNLMCSLGADGTLTVRVTGAAIASGTTPWFGFTYFVP